MLKPIAAAVFLVVLCVASLMIGVAEISFSDFFNGNQHANSIYIVSRIPRLLAIVLAGAGLSVSGLIMQQIVQNKFAAPSTMGTIDCAMLGYIVGILVLGSAAQWSYLGFIFAFAVFGTMLLVRFLQHLKFKSAVLVPLIGIMYGNVVSALTTFIAHKYDLVQTMSAWTMANFASVLQGSYEILYLAVPACMLAYYFASQFSAASIGESFAKNIGLNYQKIVFIGVALVAICASSVVMIVGVIPFLGLIVPNIVSLMMGDNMKRILPWTAYWGVILVLACDLLARVVIFPYEIPISMVISIFGGLIFIYLIMRDKSNA
ncbi:iron chelate uptake ABC transporter family permease subunit [Vibrio sp. 10N.261.52.A1]|uniref:ABC transporter permease n=1 Tax=Vibrio TaxID=662 RepID=UPI000C816072|nr:iron chelate uptake ABC transporter family permease subunit [Vibrio sp. 10N.261.52.A1]PML19122.1 iron ABC transporter [Vibrio sp. 10N.261.52.A1]